MIWMPLSIPAGIADALAYTLVYSIWQSLLIFTLLKAALFIAKDARVRYASASAAMLLALLSSAVTFFLLYKPAAGTQTYTIQALEAASPTLSAMNEKVHWTSSVSSFISAGRNYIVFAWLAGCLIYLTRFGIGIGYLARLQNKATVITGEWQELLNKLALRVGMKTGVVLRESLHVSAPMVIGFFKPCILLPVALVSGLNTAQIEAILIHELFHIKRNDFLVNLAQSTIEALLFFNPFVWAISSEVRKEREHCCDDAVLQYGGDRRAYVFALAALQEASIQHSPALSLLGNKNLLLQRIKRLMKNSVTKTTYREKLVPAIFLVTGLLCASWFSIQKGPKTSSTFSTHEQQVAADTSIKKKEKTSSYIYKKTITSDEEVAPVAEVEETFFGNEELKAALAEVDLALAALPVPDIELMEAMAPMQSFHLSMDTIPPFGKNGNWKQFEEQFAREFEAHFQNFYRENQEEFHRMMDDFERNFEPNLEHIHEMTAAVQARSEEVRKHALAMAEHAEQMREQEHQVQKLTEQARRWEREHARTMEKMEEKVKKMQVQLEAFEKAVHEELVKDGYLNAGEKIRSMQWEEDGKRIIINGTEIRESDTEKYRELQRKHMKD